MITYIDEKKSIWQATCVEKWRVNKGIGTTVAATGAGKTKILIDIIIKLNNKNVSDKSIIVVPSTALKNDWTGYFIKNKEGEKEFIKGHIQIFNLINIEVFVVNTYIKTKHSCTLLGIDEIHRFAAKTFSKVFATTTYKFVKGLTATFERLDDKHKLIEKYCPVINTLNEEEAKYEGFISDSIVFNLLIQLTDEEKEIYNYFSTLFKKCFKDFDFDFDLMISCMTSLNPRYISELNEWQEAPNIQFCKSKGWKGESLEIAISRFFANKRIDERNALLSKGVKKEKKIKIYELDMDNEYNPINVMIKAKRGVHSSKMRNQFTYTLNRKKDIIKELVSKIEGKIITFGKSSKFADMLSTDIKNSLSYHSGIKSIKQRKQNLYEFKEGDLKVLNTVEALNEGLDVKGVGCTIRASQDRSKIKGTQTRGRGGRLDYDDLNKVALHINLCIDDFLYNGKTIISTEKSVINTNQSKKLNAIWVNSVDELINQYEMKKNGKDSLI